MSIIEPSELETLIPLSPEFENVLLRIIALSEDCTYNPEKKLDETVFEYILLSVELDLRCIPLLPEFVIVLFCKRLDLEPVKYRAP